MVCVPLALPSLRLKCPSTRYSTFVRISSSVLRPFYMSTASLPSRSAPECGMRTRQCIVGAQAGRAAGVAHLQSTMRSIARSFQSSGMLIVDEEAASH